MYALLVAVMVGLGFLAAAAIGVRVSRISSQTSSLDRRAARAPLSFQAESAVVLFDEFDHDRDGKISREDLAAIVANLSEPDHVRMEASGILGNWSELGGFISSLTTDPAQRRERLSVWHQLEADLRSIYAPILSTS